MSRLVAVPNVSEGRDEEALDAIGAAFATHADVLHRSSDPDHHRAVFFLAGAPGELHRSLAAGAAAAAERIDLTPPRRAAPARRRARRRAVVYLDDAQRGAAIAEALLAADAIGATGIPVYLYGELADGRTRAELRRGGPAGLAARGTPPDYGPSQLHPTAGATLVSARPPLIALNLELAPPATLERGARCSPPRSARAAATACPACARSDCELERRGVVQVSTNIEDHRAVTATDVLERRGAPAAGSRAPSWSPPPRRRRSPAGPRTSNCACPVPSKPSLGANV